MKDALWDFGALSHRKESSSWEASLDTLDWVSVAIPVERTREQPSHLESLPPLCLTIKKASGKIQMCCQGDKEEHVALVPTGQLC